MMTEENLNAGGIAGESSGQQTSEQSSEGAEKKDLVAYETHKKLLSEKKKAVETISALTEKIQSFEQLEKDRSEKELREKEDWKKLVDVREQELSELRSQVQENQARTVNARKLDAVLRTIGVDIEEQYWPLINVAEVAIDPSTDSIDEMSVTKYVEDFRKKYPKVCVSTKTGPGVPLNAPQGLKSPSDDITGMNKQEKLKYLGEVMTRPRV